MKAQIVSEIHYSDIKKGDIIQVEGHDKTYVVIQHGQTYHLIPININCNDVIKINMYDIYKPTIKVIFDGKNGDAKFIKM